LLADRPQAQMTRIYEAMGLGALDVVACPLDEDGKLLSHSALRVKLRTLAKILGLSVAPPSALRGKRRRCSASCRNCRATSRPRS
jgi:hypothetical protein